MMGSRRVRAAKSCWRDPSATRETGRRNSSGMPALRDPAKYAVTYKARIFDTPPCASGRRFLTITPQPYRRHTPAHEHGHTSSRGVPSLAR